MTGLMCSVCGQPQFDTPSGITCGNGHGGATGVEKAPEVVTPPALTVGYRQNFETLKRACINGELALVSVIRKSDKQPVALVCGMQANSDGSISPVPFAEMVSGNPYAMYEDPTVV